MRYKCWNCGHIFDEEDADTRTEHEEFWGAPCSIEYMVCPECGEDISDEDEYTEEEEEKEEEDSRLTEEQVLENWENGYFSNKEEYKDGDD